MATRTVDIQWPATYEYREVTRPKSLLLLLHGYQQNGAIMMQQLADMAEPHQAVLAPDGLFPVPIIKKDQPLRLGFSWYVFDPSSNCYIVEMDTACGYIASLVHSLGLDHVPIRIIGFSMGAYLAPHVGLSLEHCQHVIGINGRFRSEVLTQKLPFVLDGLAGEIDRMVDPKRAQSCHQEILAKGTRGQFVLQAGEGHALTEQMINKTHQLVQLHARAK